LETTVAGGVVGPHEGRRRRRRIGTGRSRAILDGHLVGPPLTPNGEIRRTLAGVSDGHERRCKKEWSCAIAPLLLLAIFWLLPDSALRPNDTAVGRVNHSMLDDRGHLLGKPCSHDRYRRRSNVSKSKE
jgi:hypothetical protein